MPGPKPLDPSSSPRAMLGAELRHKREEAGLTQEELGRHLFVSGSFIGQLEAGTRRMQLEYAVKIDEVLGTDGYFTRNCEAATKSKYPDHFAEAAEAEAVAASIREYAPQLIPGLLQTKAYAWAVCRAYQPTAPEDVIEETVTARLERTRLLDHPTTPLLWVVLDEAVLRRKTGGPVVMAEALWHVVELARRHRIIVQVLPFKAGGHAVMGGALKLMDFDDAPPLTYFEGPGTGVLEDDPATVTRYELAYDLVGASALSPQDSLALIESVAEDYAHEDQP
ncbi:Helix-turn-helix domain-containing protein [Streptomyces sp. 2224.1]|uniref:helix-turn-helix domain-containing protein n=1 Tax=unclassified Streptomyces TaxID=2593676 RepID=UPI000882C30C|nr:MULTISPECIES: helix-turn-helix transcriptional regulator [unclassified Streptomyces]PBC84361.1 helix-turn-helix protein [Streptomyces sp. 2321.6]SDR31843.1 Helix-turn-helix domain-containing protein [Streptomyces sp. KS_16]SEB74238.1 Helix-turn-helix domain-containing protein [Streptomyces sp. 2224.1]SED28683.1 Helix-turn-helix domain-containing protein [Streptomyces sp. 2133.1]SEE55085.1 Helix-turn-helix domain-containing protein [Streptomyces sp. 2112.3]